MPLIVLSYRQELDKRHSPGDWDNYCDSDLSFGQFRTPNEAATFIAERLHEYPEASFAHLVCDTWENAQALGRCNGEPEVGISSIKMPPLWQKYWKRSTNSYEAEVERKAKLMVRLRKLVKAKLAAMPPEGEATPPEGSEANEN